LHSPEDPPDDQVSPGQSGADGVFFWDLGTPIEGKAGEKLVMLSRMRLWVRYKR
jgi:hypothetical protein